MPFCGVPSPPGRRRVRWYSKLHRPKSCRRLPREQLDRRPAPRVRHGQCRNRAICMHARIRFTTMYIYSDPYPPLKRPSVRHATSWPRPAPMIKLVGFSISRMPGPPLGPRYRRTTTVFSPLRIEPVSTAVTNFSSVSNVRAFPVKFNPSFPVTLATAPPGAKLPRKILAFSWHFKISPETQSYDLTECVQSV